MPILVMAGLPKLTIRTANLPHFDELADLMRKDNYSEDTISRYTTILQTLTKRGADLMNPESVKDVISKQTKWAEGTKAAAVNSTLLLYHYLHIEAEFPEYKAETKIPFIPLEAELDQLIAGCKHQLATFLQALKETASRCGELLNLKWTDYDTERGTITIASPEKGSNPRQVKISTKLISMLASLPHQNNKVFQYRTKKHVRTHFERARKRIAKNLGNERIHLIHFHTFRHWKATTEFHKTNNIILVMKLLGHKSLSNTQRYIQLLPDLADDYVCEVATTLQEATKLIENGFEYVTEMEGKKLFKKRK